MYKIGEFSIISKTTIKTLRYYEKEKLLLPYYIDKQTGYRYYETNQLVDLSKIIALRQIGTSIKNIKEILNGGDIQLLLRKRKEEIENSLKLYNSQLSKINYILEGKNMNYEVVLKELPDYNIYYKEGVIKDFSQIVSFILSSGEECRKLNPDIKCLDPDYCYVSYLDGEYKDKDIKIRYAQAVEKIGIGNGIIKFEKLEPVRAVCIYHKGTYSKLPDAYKYIMKYVEDNGYRIVEAPRERYIDGMWNKENEENWLTEIQVPIEKI